MGDMGRSGYLLVEQRGNAQRGLAGVDPAKVTRWARGVMPAQRM